MRILAKVWSRLIAGVTPLSWMRRLWHSLRHCSSGWPVGRWVFSAFFTLWVSLNKLHGNFPDGEVPFFGQESIETITTFRKTSVKKTFSYYKFSILLIKWSSKYNWHIYLVSDTMTPWFVKTQITIWEEKEARLLHFHNHLQLQW